ncbi:T-cell surface antigen CD2-like isoform 3-T3 [Salvelinus alpinus]
MACTLPLAFLVLHGFLSLSADSCDYYLQHGSFFSIPLKYTDLSSKEITWKHNGNVILKRKNGMFKPGKAEDILDDGSLQLKGLSLANEGTYKAEVFNSDGKSIKEESFSLCMKEKVSKPSVEITCSAKYVTFTCILTNTEGVTFKWSKNRQPINEKTKILTIGLIELKEPDAFTCSAVNEVSMETSDIIKPTCNAVSKSGDRHSLFGFDFLTMVSILAGGGGLVLLLIIIITLVCCCLSRRKSQMRFEEGQKQRQRPPGPRPEPQARPRPNPEPRLEGGLHRHQWMTMRSSPHHYPSLGRKALAPPGNECGDRFAYILFDLRKGVPAV